MFASFDWMLNVRARYHVDVSIGSFLLQGEAETSCKKFYVTIRIEFGKRKTSANGWAFLPRFSYSMRSVYDLVSYSVLVRVHFSFSYPLFHSFFFLNARSAKYNYIIFRIFSSKGIAAIVNILGNTDKFSAHVAVVCIVNFIRVNCFMHQKNW